MIRACGVGARRGDDADLRGQHDRGEPGRVGARGEDVEDPPGRRERGEPSRSDGRGEDAEAAPVFWAILQDFILHFRQKISILNDL